MPIYAYRCDACGHAQDVLQKMSDPLLSTCPACGATAFKKQLTAAGFQLKGSGWYATDFRNGAAKPAATGDDGAKSDAPPKTDAAPKTDATPKSDSAAPAAAPPAAAAAAPAPPSDRGASRGPA